MVPSVLLAGTTGKIAGVIRDQSTKEPLPGANVIVEGTTLGAATDAHGYYFIINVPPGNYRVTASMLGYVRTSTENVRVSADLTTKVDFALEPTVLELGKVVTVEAERPLVEPDVTTKRFTVTAEQIRDMPVTDVRQIMTLQTGVFEMQGYQNKIPGFEARGLDQVHVRGGRNGEIAYMIDGMYVEDAIYAGMGTFINREAINELSVLVGNFSAEYGQAQSSVVNIVTKEGRDVYTGLLEFSSGELAGALGSQQDNVRDYHDAIGSFGGPVPGLKNVSFFVSGEQSFRRYAALEFDDFTYDTTCVQRDPVTGKCKKRAGDLPENQHYVYGAMRKAFAAFDDNGNPVIWDNVAGWRAFGFYHNYDILGKLTFRFTPSMKLIVSERIANRRFRDFNFNWQFAQNGRHVTTDNTEQQGVLWTHQLSPKTFYEIRGNRFWKLRRYRIPYAGHELEGSYYGREYNEYPSGQYTEGFAWPLRFVGYDTLSTDPLRLRWVFTGSATQYWTRNYQQTWEATGSLTSQVTPEHQLKAGIEFKRYDIKFEEQQYPWIEEPYEEHYYEHPVEISGYLQDKMEFKNLIVNAGLRLDYADSKGGMWKDPKDPTSGFTIGKSKYQVSPRLTISYPITERSIFRFSYGHFFQIPEYRNLYVATSRDLRDLEQRLRTPRPLLGNPHLDAQKTIAYEIGFQQQFGEDWALELTAWHKENSGEAGTINIIGFDPEYYGVYNYYVFANYDYGSSKGFDIGLRKRYSNYFQGVLNYSYMVAKANRYYSWSGYWDAQTAETEPKKEYLADYDQPHVVTLNLDVAFPKTFGPALWGFRPLGDFVMDLIFRGAAGLPYTPSFGGQSLEPNTGRRPWTMTLDAIIRKDFTLTGKLKLGLFSRIYNLFDRKNPLTVYAETGDPKNPGPSASKTLSSTYYDRPHYFGPRRSIDLGVKILF